MGKKVPLITAAEVLGISQSSLRRRINVLGLDPAKDDAGRSVVDPDEVGRLWEDRQRAVRHPSGKMTAPLSVLVDPEEREEVDAIAERHGFSLGETVRRLLHLGLVGYYRADRKL